MHPILRHLARRAIYRFQDRVDQLVRMKSEHLGQGFPGLAISLKKPWILVHRTIRFGRRKQVGAFDLAVDPAISIQPWL